MRGIYQITIYPPNLELVYVGKAEILERRQRQHLNALLRGDHWNDYVQRAYDKYGLTESWFTVLERVPGDDEDELLRAEQYWFDRRVEELGRRYVMNLMRPEKNPLHDPEVRERQQARLREVLESEEWRGKARAALERRRLDPEWEARRLEGLRAARQDPRKQQAFKEAAARAASTRAQNPEWREKTAAATRAANAKRYIVTTPSGEEVEVYNLAAYCRERGLDVGAMANVIAGKTRHHKGYKARRLNEEEVLEK